VVPLEMLAQIRIVSFIHGGFAMISPFKYLKPPDLFSIFISALFFINCGGEKNSAKTMLLAKLIPDEFDGWKAEGDIQSYNRETIFDYIDGAGEVYLMYGFKDVAVKKLLNPDSVEITAELFDMGGPDDAFGIFSHAREGNDIGIGGGSEFRDGYLCFWKDRYFVCVYTYKTGEAVNDAVMGIGKTIAANIAGDVNPPELVNLLPGDGKRKSSEIYFHRQTSLNYHYYLSEKNILHLSDSTDALLARYDPGNSLLLCVKYPDPAEAKNGYDGFIAGYIPEADTSGFAETEKGKWVKAFYIGRYLAAVLDAPDRESAGSLAEEIKNNIVRMGNG
jgi:hypothetical protein